MKANKSKTSDKKTAQKVVKKELESSIAVKFLDALKGLGFDADKFSKEIKKSSKELAKKISKKYSDVKLAVDEKQVKKTETIKIKTIKSPLATKAKPTKIPSKKIPVSKTVKKSKVDSTKAPISTTKREPKKSTKSTSVVEEKVKPTKTNSEKKIQTAKSSDKIKE